MRRSKIKHFRRKIIFDYLHNMSLFKYIVSFKHFYAYKRNLRIYNFKRIINYESTIITDVGGRFKTTESPSNQP
jgi:hypothetical protein